MNEREERIGRNEILLRQVNERIEELAGRTVTQEQIGFICECGVVSCIDQVHLEPPEYEELRTNARQFVTVPGHETPELERVIVRYERYQIVEKDHGEPAELAVQTDPR